MGKESMKFIRNKIDKDVKMNSEITFTGKELCKFIDEYAEQQINYYNYKEQVILNEQTIL